MESDAAALPLPEPAETQSSLDEERIPRAVFLQELTRHVLPRRWRQGEAGSWQQDDSARLETVEHSLAGLALSGGGIRSATFALGVAESLRAHGVLQKIDYLSTVSGGGYLGAWLSANCKRAAARGDDWLAQSTAGTEATSREDEWDTSIGHLRRYSNYLSPHVGFFSADTWTMITSWLRNTLLVQAILVMAIALVLLVPRLGFWIFDAWSGPGLSPNWRWLSVATFIAAIMVIAVNLLHFDEQRPIARFFYNESTPPRSWLILGLGACGGLATLAWANRIGFHPYTNGPIDLGQAFPVAFLLVFSSLFVLPLLLGARSCEAGSRDAAFTRNVAIQWGVIFLMMLTSLFFAAILWAQVPVIHAATGKPDGGTYGDILEHAIRFWPFPLSIATVSLWALAFFSIRPSLARNKRIGLAILAPVPSVLVLYALLCAIIHLMRYLRTNFTGIGADWLAFIVGPPLILLAFSLVIVLLIGMTGRDAGESIREWWSRLGAYLNIYGFAWLLITVAAIYGPLVIGALTNLDRSWQQISAFAAWLAPILAGLIGARSAKTGGNATKPEFQKSISGKAMSAVTAIAPFVFIVGLLLLIAFVVHDVQLRITPTPGCDVADAWKELHCLSHRSHLTDLWAFLVLALVLLVFSSRIDINEFSLNAFYRSRLVRCYLGASRCGEGERKPNRFTGLDENDDLPIAELGDKSSAPAGPLHIVSCGLNLGGSNDLSVHTRHCASWLFTPYYVGTGYIALNPHGVKQALGYKALGDYSDSPRFPTLGHAIAISGAAASPNMGYHTTSSVAFMLTAFNLRLGGWFANPWHASKEFAQSPPNCLWYLVSELFGRANERSKYLMISDGGHFENLGAYELIRRRCRLVIVSDAECDVNLGFEGLGRLIRMCEVDFGTKIRIDVTPIRADSESGWSQRGFAVGSIGYGQGFPDGVLIYLKASMTGKEGTAIRQYQQNHPRFPHESTGDQFYSEDQFESYRNLGKEVADSAFGSIDPQCDFLAFANDLRTKFGPRAATPRFGPGQTVTLTFRKLEISRNGKRRRL